MNKQIQFAIVALVLSLGLAIYGIIVFANAEKGRDLQALQTQMSLVADSRVEAIEHWLKAQYTVLEGLARHESLRQAVASIGAESAGARATACMPCSPPRPHARGSCPIRPPAISRPIPTRSSMVGWPCSTPRTASWRPRAECRRSRRA
ncbi:MAG: hypothetical protein MZV65_27245 [Chromatiales bacterium]|nr:hypothetical protein [Chromatiales bacterium]